MDEKRQVYGAITDIWHLWKKYGGGRLEDRQWESFLLDGQQMRKKHEAAGKEADMLFRDLFMALQEYYRRKEVGQ